MSIEEASELARRAIYHATFRDGASGGVASGIIPFLPDWPAISICLWHFVANSQTLIKNCLTYTHMFF
jgi:hypothetical protein